MANKTIQATLVKPTAHKEQKLNALLKKSQRIFHDALELKEMSQDVSNKSLEKADVNEEMFEALMRFIELNESDHSDIDDVTLQLNRPSILLDKDSDREYEFCWKVPALDSFWIPLKINPLQQSLWKNLSDGGATPLSLKLQRHTNNWVLTVDIHLLSNESRLGPLKVDDSIYNGIWLTEDPSRTPVGIDIGENHLVTGCVMKKGRPVNPVLFDGNAAKQIRKEMYTTLNRLDEKGVAEWRIKNKFESYRNKLIDITEKASKKAVNYACQFKNPVVVMEYLNVGGESLEEAMFEHRRLNMWSFNYLQRRIGEKANNNNIPAAFVKPENTSQVCHICRHFGTRESSFHCLNEQCWVSEYQSDINAAANISHRYNPWGESCSLKSSGNDFPRDGSSSDGTTEPHEQGDNLDKTSRVTRFETQPAGHWSPSTGTSEN